MYNLWNRGKRASRVLQRQPAVLRWVHHVPRDGLARRRVVWADRGQVIIIIFRDAVLVAILAAR